MKPNLNLTSEKPFSEKHKFCRGASYATFIMKFIPLEI